MSDSYIEVVNWEQHQHYSKRTAPWIKVHHALLDTAAFCLLPDESKLHLLLLWLLAARMGNKLPADEEWLTAKLYTQAPVRLQPLLDAGFIRARGTKPPAKAAPASTTKAERVPYDKIVETWNEFAGEVGLPCVRRVSATHKAKLKTRWTEWAKDGEPFDVFAKICDAVRESELMLGKTGRSSWRGATLWWLTKNDHNWVKVLEGEYRDADTTRDVGTIYG